MINNSLVSVVIATKNSEQFLEICLKSIKNQSHKNTEVVIVDSFSSDATRKIAKKYGARVFTYKSLNKVFFESTKKRNLGVKMSRGDFVYIFDADMEMSKDVIKNALKKCSEGYSGIIIPEDSVGIGIWARAKNLERRCYWGDDSVEAPRFFAKKVWDKVGGLDETVGGGGDDWDIYQKLIENDFEVGRIKSLVRHHEGKLTLSSLLKKRFLYGKESLKYLKKRPRKAISSYFPIRWSYLKNAHLFIMRPLDGLAFLIMRFLEYTAGLSGIIYSYFLK